MWIRLTAFVAFSLLAFAETKPDPWRLNQVMQPAALAQKFSSGSAPTILMVGPRILYNGNHIKGAVFAGPAGTDAGIDLLKQKVAGLPKSAEIVLYCGCCPMDRCPNIRPAFSVLRGAGYKSLKIVQLPTNLKTDWTDKGYPVEKGEIAK